MKYIIGEILDQYVKSTSCTYVDYATERAMGEAEFASIRRGHRTASADKLSTLVDIELLRIPILDELKNIIPSLNTLDTETLIKIYNFIYIYIKKHAKKEKERM